MRVAIAAADPGSEQDQLLLSSSYRTVGQMLVTTGDLQGGLAYASKALGLTQSLAASEPHNLEYLDELQNSYELIGDIQGGNGLSANLGDTTAALENHRKALALAEGVLKLKPNDPHVKRGLAIYHIKVADDLVKQGDRVTALEDYRQALDSYKSMAEGSVNAVYVREINLLYTRIGDVQLMDGDNRGAFQSYRAAMDIAENLASADPKNALAQEDLATGYGMLGKADANAGNTKAGLAFLKKAIALMGRQVAADPKHMDWQRILGLLYVWRGQALADSGKTDAALADFRRNAAIQQRFVAMDARDQDAKVTLAATQTKIADVLLAKGDPDAAVELYKKALAVVEPLAHSSPPNTQAQYVTADASSGIGDAFARRSLHASADSGKLEYLSQARSWLERSFGEWKQVRSPGRVSPIGFDTAGPGAVAEKLARIEAELTRLKVPPAR
jgi:tetratricopeptide (TPR) repeat protein